MRPQAWHSIAVAAFLSLAQNAHAYDVRVDSDTLFRAYEVRSQVTRAFWTRRRFSQRLSLDLSAPLSDQQPLHPTPRLQVRLDLRLDQELGETCLVADESQCFIVTDGDLRARYEPLAEDGRLSVPIGYLEATGLPLGLQLRAGRQVFWDPIGFARADGLRLQAQPWRWLSTDIVYGVLVRHTSFGGRDAYVPSGIPRLDLPSDILDRSPGVDVPLTATIAGASGHLGTMRWARVGGHFREIVDGSGLLQREAAVSVSSLALSPLLVNAHGVFDARDGALVDGQAELDFQLGAVNTRARLRRQVPRFDYGSIWAFFAVAPSWQASVGSDARVATPLSVGLELRGRRLEPAGELAPDVDLGALGRAEWRRGRLDLDLSAFAWQGDLGATWGIDGGGRYRITRWLACSGRVSAYRLEGVSAGLSPSVAWGEQVGAELAIADGMRGSLELGHGYSVSVGHRLSLLGWLHMGAWR